MDCEFRNMFRVLVVLSSLTFAIHAINDSIIPLPAKQAGPNLRSIHVHKIEQSKGMSSADDGALQEINIPKFYKDNINLSDLDQLRLQSIHEVDENEGAKIIMSKVGQRDKSSENQNILLETDLMIPEDPNVKKDESVHSIFEHPNSLPQRRGPLITTYQKDFSKTMNNNNSDNTDKRKNTNSNEEHSKNEIESDPIIDRDQTNKVYEFKNNGNQRDMKTNEQQRKTVENTSNEDEKDHLIQTLNKNGRKNEANHENIPKKNDNNQTNIKNTNENDDKINTNQENTNKNNVIHTENESRTMNNIENGEKSDTNKKHSNEVDEQESNNIDPCLICDCKSNTLLNCNRKNLSNNYTRIINSNLLSYKYSTLCLSNNNIEKIIRFNKLEQLTRLCLSSNKINQIQDGAFKYLNNLISLDLSFNKLNNFIVTPNVFQGNYAPDYYEPLKSLKILNLSHNDFHSLNSDLFEHLPNLEEINFSHNPLKVLDMPTSIALSSVSYLKVLDLSYTELDFIPNHLLHTPLYLHTLNLSFNKFKEIPEQLIQSHNLQVLRMDGNPIENIRSFPSLSKLHTLSLSYMPELTTIQANSLSNLVSLQEFNCSHNSKLNFLHWSTFSKIILSEDGQTRTTVWPPLEKLILSNNALSRIEGTLIARWDKLTILDIRFNPWLCDCENQWLVSVLMPLLEANHPEYINGHKCREPIEMRNINLLDLDHKNYHMRCLDIYNNRPEYDGVILFVLLLVLILLIPLCINIMIYVRKRRSPSRSRCPNVHYSRAFYKPARTSDASDVINTHYIL